MIEEFVEIIGGTKTLTATNVILAVCIIFHMVCEFGHYIHEYISRKRDGNKLESNNKLLLDLAKRVEKIEQTMSTKRCPLKEEDHVIHIK